MKLLVIGAGGREHAIIWKLLQNENVDKIYAAPGNAGTASMEKTENINISDIEGLLKFAKTEKIDLTILGSEELLVAGIVDKFQAEGLKIFGPHQKAAMLEGSKTFSKDFMKKYGVKTAAYENFDNYDKAFAYLDNCEYPLVIKASGLAAGKGVIIAQNRSDAEEALKDIMLDSKFGNAGAEVVIEEFLEGVEASILSFYDGNIIVPFVSAKDHKKIGEGEIGLNTGGMGVIAPNPYVDEDVKEAFEKDILQPTLQGLKAEGLEFSGVIFFGLMITSKGVHSLEYNMRMGDPETQAVLPLLENDFLDLILHALEGGLDMVEVKWKKKSAVCVVMAAGGYPESYKKGDLIEGLENVDNQVFMAGVKNEDGFRTNGGRVLNLVALGDNLVEARKNAYEDIKKISFDNCYYRKDIGEVK